MVDNVLNLLLAPQFVVNIVHEMGGDGGFTIVAGISSTSTQSVMTNAEVKAAYEANVNTNVFDDSEKTKLATVETNAAADQTGAEIKTAYEGEADTNAFNDAAVSKLAGIEAGATGDQSNAEIRTAVEAATDSNVFTDAENTKLNAIEASATADQSNAEIRAAVEAATDSNAFTDADHTKLNSVESNATADQTGAEIKTAYEGEANAYTDVKNTKLAGIETSAKDDQTNAEIRAAVAAATDSNVFTDSQASELAAIEASATADQTNAEIKAAVEAATDSNTFTDADHSKLNAIEAVADVTDAGNVDAAGAVMDNDISEGEGFIRKTGSGTYTAVKTNLGAITNPGTGDDNTGGYAIGSRWINVTLDKEFVCLDITTAAAVWVETTAGGAMSDAEIKTAYENNANTNAFDDAEQTKLAGIETSATADQTNAEIRTAVEAATDSNVFNDADHTKLNAIEASATIDQTDAEIRTAVEAATNSNVFTDADHTKLDAIETAADVTDATNVEAANAIMDSDISAGEGFIRKTGSGAYAAVKTNLGATTNPGTGDDNTTGYAIGSRWINVTLDKEYVCLDITTGAAVWTETTTNLTNAEIRAAVEAATDSNVFTDADHSKLDAVEASADVTDAGNVAAAGAVMDTDFATATAKGIVELATIAEVNTGTDATRAVTPSSLKGSALQTKVDGIETSATADQTNAEIRAAVEAATDSNIFTDAENTKLGAIEASATTDQTNAEIKAAVEAATDSNVFNDADHTKLDGLEASADVTDATNVEAAGAIMDGDISAGEGFLRKTGAGAYEGIKSNLGATVDPNANDDTGDGYVVGSLWINTTGDRVFQCVDNTSTAAVWKDLSAGSMSNAEIRAAVEAATDSNVFTDADHTKLDGVEASSTADQTGAEIKSAYEGEADTNAYNDAAVTSVGTIASKAPLASPALSGNPTAPTQASGNNSTRLATTAFTKAGFFSGTKTISSSAPSGGANGDVWFVV